MNDIIKNIEAAQLKTERRSQRDLYRKEELQWYRR